MYPGTVIVIQYLLLLISSDIHLFLPALSYYFAIHASQMEKGCSFLFFYFLSTFLPLLFLFLFVFSFHFYFFPIFRFCLVFLFRLYSFAFLYFNSSLLFIYIRLYNISTSSYTHLNLSNYNFRLSPVFSISSVLFLGSNFFHHSTNSINPTPLWSFFFLYNIM